MNKYTNTEIRKVTNNIAPMDRLTIKTLMWATDMQREPLVRILTNLGLPFELDDEGTVYTSRRAFGAIMRALPERQS